MNEYKVEYLDRKRHFSATYRVQARDEIDAIREANIWARAECPGAVLVGNPVLVEPAK